MTDKQKLEKIKVLADAMYNAASNITTDASHLKKAMYNYHQFVIQELHKEDSVSNDLEEAAWQYYDRNKPLMPSELNLHKELIDFFKAGVRWKEQNDSNLSEVLYRDNLDEMAEEYSSCTYLEEVLGEVDIEVLKARLKNTFKAGAQWQKEQALAAVEIAREELIDKACEWLNNFYSEDRHCYLVAEDIKAFKQAMEEQL